MMRLVVGLLVAVGVAMTGGDPAGAQPVQAIRVSMLAPNALLWTHAVATARGFYAARGIRIEELRTASSPALLQAVATGSVEAGVALGDLAMRAVDLSPASAAPVVIAGAILDRVSLRLVGGAGVTSIGQLAGQPVSAGAVEGGTANLMRFLLKRAGVDPRGVRMVSITASSDRLVALGNGQVKGALMTAPFDALAVQQGMAILDTYREPYLLAALVVNTGWAARDPAGVRKLVQALRDAAAWMYEPANRDETIRILAEYTKTDAAVCVDAYAFLIERQRAISRTMAVSAASLENITMIDRDVGASPAAARPFELGRYYDPRFLGAAP